MPVLPLIDLLLFGGWTALFAGFVLKVVGLTTSYQPTILGMSPTDFLLVAVASMLFAIALAARTWVKTQAPAARAARLRQETMDAWQALPGNHDGSDVPSDTDRVFPIS
jgi:hypothetical protein